MVRHSHGHFFLSLLPASIPANLRLNIQYALPNLTDFNFTLLTKLDVIRT